jgi:hypothetical protein
MNTRMVSDTAIIAAFPLDAAQVSDGATNSKGRRPAGVWV